MELVLFNQVEKSFFRDVVNLGDKRISTINGLIIMKKSERREVVEYSRKIYREVVEKSGKTDFFGHIRIDLVPSVKNLRKTARGYKWDLSISGVYEINSNSPECGAATAALHDNFKELAEKQPDPAKRIIESLNGHINGEKIAFVVGKGAVKKEWGHVFMRSLQEKGLNIEEVGPEEAEKYECVWRFGDMRCGSYSEFSKKFRRMLLQKQERDLVLNTVPESPEKDIGNKRYLLSENERELKNKDDLKWALRQKDMVLKPFRGTSGRGIYFQKDMDEKMWVSKLKECKGQDYGLFKSKWLPRIEIDEVDGGVAMDLSPSFLARGKKLDYLYSISRIEEFDVYQKRSTINVARGGGFAGTLLDNKN